MLFLWFVKHLHGWSTQKPLFTSQIQIPLPINFLSCSFVCITLLLPHARDWRLRSTQNNQATIISRSVKSLALLRCCSLTGVDATSRVENVSPPFHHVVFMYRNWAHLRVISSYKTSQVDWREQSVVEPQIRCTFGGYILFSKAWKLPDSLRLGLLSRSSHLNRPLMKPPF